MADTETGTRTTTEATILTVDIVVGGKKMMLRNAKFPDHCTTEQVIALLVRHVGMTLVDEADAQRITYSLVKDKTGVALRRDATLRESGVRDGDVLHLFSARPVETPQEMPALPFAPKPDDSEVRVHLTVMDSPKPHPTRLPLDTPVGDLLRQLIKEHKVLERDRFSRSGNFRLSNEGTARLLASDRTLRQEGVMHEDHIKLLKDEAPGAEP
jgi:hypothetical protein